MYPSVERRRRWSAPCALICGALAALPAVANASEPAPVPDGSTLGLVWTLPFVALVLSVAIVPQAAGAFWHDHHGKIAAFWAFAFIVPCALVFGLAATVQVLARALVAAYLPFILVLAALFGAAGGIRLRGRLAGTPCRNLALLASGAILANIIGTTGAAILLVRPLIAGNAARRHRAHVFVFFIILVGNIGGALSPLGNPPLFLGFLAGVPFFWPTTHLAVPTLLLGAAILAIFFALDTALFRRDGSGARDAPPGPAEAFGIDGKGNLVLLAVILGAILLGGLWHPGVIVQFLGISLALEDFARDAILMAVAAVAQLSTDASVRDANEFSWFPMLEVAKLFAGIFVTIAPAVAILRAGADGALESVVALLRSPSGAPLPALYFWLSGALSSALDSAPTYLMFFNVAGGDPGRLAGELSTTLAAISAGAVFMGANSYIGNAPNFLIKSICESRGIVMPSFAGYALWAGALLLPLYALLTLLFFR